MRLPIPLFLLLLTGLGHAQCPLPDADSLLSDPQGRVQPDSAAHAREILRALRDVDGFDLRIVVGGPWTDRNWGLESEAEWLAAKCRIGATTPLGGAVILLTNSHGGTSWLARYPRKDSTEARAKLDNIISPHYNSGQHGWWSPEDLGTQVLELAKGGIRIFHDEAPEPDDYERIEFAVMTGWQEQRTLVLLAIAYALMGQAGVRMELRRRRRRLLADRETLPLPHLLHLIDLPDFQSLDHGLAGWSRRIHLWSCVALVGWIAYAAHPIIGIALGMALSLSDSVLNFLLWGRLLKREQKDPRGNGTAVEIPMDMAALNDVESRLHHADKGRYQLWQERGSVVKRFVPRYHADDWLEPWQKGITVPENFAFETYRTRWE